MAAPNDSIAFSDTTNKNGIIQAIEFWTNLGDTAISGNSTLLAIFTARVNEGFDRLMPLVLSYCDKPRFDDVNHTDLPIATINIVSGQADYKVTTDDNSLNILNLTDIMILQSASDTEYITLDKITMDDERALDAMSPNPSVTGIPSHWLEKGNVVFLYPEPNYASTNGLKLFFERDPSYFISSDTTKKPGIPRPFHGLRPLYASYDWLLVNKPENGILITRIETQIARREKELSNLISSRNPVRKKMTMKKIQYL